MGDFARRAPVFPRARLLAASSLLAWAASAQAGFQEAPKSPTTYGPVAVPPNLIPIVKTPIPGSHPDYPAEHPSNPKPPPFVIITTPIRPVERAPEAPKPPEPAPPAPKAAPPAPAKALEPAVPKPAAAVPAPPAPKPPALPRISPEASASPIPPAPALPAAPETSVPPADPSGEPEYSDRVLDASELTAIAEETAAEERQSQGSPRSLRVEASLYSARLGGSERNEASLSALGFWGTDLWGDFSFQGAYSAETVDAPLSLEMLGEGSIGSFTLWNRNLRLGDRLSLDSSIGSLSSPAPELARSQYRFFLPSPSLLGASASLSLSKDSRIFASAGRPGSFGGFSGLSSSGFEALPGTFWSAGGESRINEHWMASGMAIGSVLSEPPPPSSIANAPVETTAAFGAVARRDKDSRYQANALVSEADGKAAAGIWGDILLGDGARLSHRIGAYWLQPDLAWGLAPIPADAMGAYYRAESRYGRWSWNAGGEYTAPVEADNPAVAYASGHLRHQFSSRLGLGGSLAARDRGGLGAVSGSVFADSRGDWGLTRLDLSVASEEGGSRRWRALAGHHFDLGDSSRLSAEATYESATLPSGDEDELSFSLMGSALVGDGVSLDGEARARHRLGEISETWLDANIGLTAALAKGWSLSAKYYRSEGFRENPFSLAPVLSAALDPPSGDSLRVSLSYDFAAGRPSMVIGGPPGSPAGRLRGVAFLDENSNGLFDAGERGASDIEVSIDGAFSTRTDSSGRFEFPLVISGRHRLAFSNDNLPLPWAFSEEPVEISVETRGDVFLAVGALPPR